MGTIDFIIEMTIVGVFVLTVVGFFGYAAVSYFVDVYCKKDEQKPDKSFEPNGSDEKV